MNKFSPRFLTIISLACLSLTSAFGATALPESGSAVPGFEPMDTVMRTLLAKWKLSGGSLAVVKDGRLVYARAFGYADPANNVPFLPTTTGRIGSIAKTITATEILRLVERGRLSLDATVFGPAGILNNIVLPANADPRIKLITVRNLLNMASGWDKATTGDVLVPPLMWDEAQFLRAPLPLTLPDYGTAQTRLPLEETPGLVYRYMNTSPMHLAMIIERITGRKYVDVIQSDVLGPIGIKSASIAALRSSERRLDEAVYDDFNLNSASLYPGEGIVPLSGAFGVLDITGCGPTGGWVCTSTDLARFWASLSGVRAPALVKPETYAQMISRPAGISPWNTGTSYWFGFDTENYDNGQTRSKYGSLPGTATWVAQKANGYIVAVIFNARDAQVGHPNGFTDIGGNLFDVDVRSSLDRGLKQITSVPGSDLFNSSYAANRPAFSNSRVAGGVVGRNFLFSLTTFFPGATFTAVNLPPGLTYNPQTRRIEGMPTKAGNFSTLITATYGEATVRNKLALTITTPLSPVLSGTGTCSVLLQNQIELGQAFDQVLMTGPQVTVKANTGRSVRVGFIDENDDLVQAELSGPGNLAISLAGPYSTTLQRPAKYAVATKYVKGRPTFQINGATSATIFRYYAQGAVNLDSTQLLPNVKYNGVADAASLTITGAGMKEICLNNARFVGSKDLVGIHAPGIIVTNEISLAGLAASGAGLPELTFGLVDVLTITGHTDLAQPNGAPIAVRGLRLIEPAGAGLTAQGMVVTPLPIKSHFEENGVDVTAKIVHGALVEDEPVEF